MSKYPQTMINVRVADRDRLERSPSIKAAQTEVEHLLGNRGRVLLRASGTEPLVRVMVEGEDGSLVATLAAQLAESVRRALV